MKHPYPTYLRKALRSVLEQDCPRWRLLVIGEGGHLPAVRRLVADEAVDSRIRVIPNEGRKLAGALNTGMRRAETDFVGILLGDDLWASCAVRVLSEAIETHPEGHFFHSSRIFVDEHDRPISSVHPSRESVRAEDFLDASPVKHLLCWHREKGLAVGGMDESLNSVGPDDYDFPWTMAEAGAFFVPISEALYLYRDHREGFRLTTHLPLSVHVRELRRIFAKHGVAPLVAERTIAAARASYLRQCLYRNRFDRWFKEALGFDPRRGWRETYR